VPPLQGRELVIERRKGALCGGKTTDEMPVVSEVQGEVGTMRQDRETWDTNRTKRDEL
jgi:hypothetical protein